MIGSGSWRVPEWAVALALAASLCLVPGHVSAQEEGGKAASAAEIELALAQADAFEDGDPREVLELLGPYADSDHPDVAFSLAVAHMRVAIEGRPREEVTAEDIRPAIEQARRSIELGSAHGSNLLWVIHANGWGVPVDNGVALEHLRRGVDAGETGAMLNYAMLLAGGDAGVERDLPAACVLLERLLEDEAAGPVAAHPLGLALVRGDCGEAADAARGVDLIERAASHGVREAMYDLGRAREHGMVGAVDIDEALEWFEEAAKLDLPQAQWRIGMAWLRGEGRAADSAMAVKSFERAAAGGYPEGMVSLAVMHATGDGVPLDPAKAAALYRQAADLGSGHALRSLAGMHATGEGMPADPARALELYEQAMEMGAEEFPQLRGFIEAALGQGHVH